MTAARVTAIAVDEDLVVRMKATGAEVVMLPVDESDGVGCYPEASISIPKQAKTDGISAAFLRGPGERTFEVKKSALSDAVVNVFLGIASKRDRR